MKSWKKVVVDDLDGTTNKYHRPLWVDCYWCNSLATKVVTRTSLDTGYTYSDYACKCCANEWQKDV